ncbi:MAG TPA: polysaccharide deacetylase family protein [Candidatus Binatia bacterium]|nr:polysaccharide deacetylase family protein [Candidatus Binatia bacterium]
MRNPIRYQPAFTRPRLRLPGGARLAIHVIVNIEEWDINARLPRALLSAPAGGEPVPDVPNFAWYEYGNRVGVWRFLDLLEKFRAKATLSVNANVANSYPLIVEKTHAAGWEMMGHGFIQKTMALVPDEAEVIAKTLDTLERATGQRPRGWLGPGLVETPQTLEHLAAAGIRYCCDWGPADDLPFELTLESGRAMLAVPYPVDMNDIVISAIERQPSHEIFARGKAQFDTLYAESEHNARIMAIALHPYITGVPHRIGYLEQLLAYCAGHTGVTFMRGGEIADWFSSASHDGLTTG